MTTRRTRSRQAGFTMIEVMIAVLLAAIAMVGIISLYITTTKAAGFSRHTTEAAILAEDRIEKLRTAPAAATAATVEPGLDPQGYTGTGGIYTRTYTVALNTTSYADVQVIVTWTDDGVAHQVLVNSRRNLP